MVPLHEAAKAGHIEVILAMLSMNVPAHPRTIADDTPSDLARRNGHYKCVELLCMYILYIIFYILLFFIDKFYLND